MRQRLVLLATLAGGLGGLAACHGDAVGPRENIYTYSLSAIRDAANPPAQCLPYALSQTPEETVEIIEGSLTWYASAGWYTYSYVVRTTDGSVTTETITDTGGWNLEDEAIVLISDQDGRRKQAGVGPDAFTVIDEGLRYYFRSGEPFPGC